MSVTISTQANLGPLDAAIARLEQLDAIVAKYAGLIEERAKTLVPIKTGALHDSIVTELHGLVADIVAGAGLSYAVPVEYGSHGRAARPFMRPAIEAYADEFARAIIAAVS
jgi:HK97 gp10 family phage protein